ncbi:tRNA-uridine aminocarboxypropyltransferase 1 isoform X2 [Lathamus discolor]|uniref:tRNA-uridine aminocarboxypropyltransferase 1 isoform X2 n=1 Tax=Lathamus discolor TaxID=678569 RepID=UPI0032B7CEF9
MSLNSPTLVNEENSQEPKRNSECLESVELQAPSSFQDNPLQQLQLASQELPLKIDIIKHPNETDGKSTAVHAKLLAPDDVTIYKYPCIPEYEEKRHEIALIFPGPNSVSVKDIAFHLQKYAKKGTCVNDNDCSREPFLKQAKLEPKEDLNECISTNGNEGTRLKKIIFIDSTWNQTNKIITDERLQGLLQIELKTRKTCFWRHQKGKPDTYLSTIEAIYYFLVDYHQEILKENYKGQYDNLLFFFSFMYTLIKNAKCCAGRE